MARIRYRVAKASDSIVLAKSRYDFRVELDRATERKSVFVRRCTAWMKRELRRGVWRCWLAESDGDFVGNVWIAVIEKIPNPVGEPRFHVYVSNCYVVPEMRSRKVGERLLKRALAWCRAKGADAVFLWPTARSRSFYSKCGFETSRSILVRQRKSRATHHRQIPN